ncbi:MAG: hypothetical protein SFY32_14925, partial [Bacteroidota bacterium]|nr:hypothetical protein [Bacteroidota bacterium]
YKILLDNDKNKDWHMETGEIDFVLMNKDDEFVTSGPILIQDIEEDIVKQQIRDTYEGIMSYDFHGCNKDDCQWCNFVKSNFTNVQQVDESEETGYS